MKNKTQAISLEPLVGSEAYGVWIKMLKSMVPHGRTHRLAVVVAGMIQYAANTSYEKDPDLYEQIFDCTDYDDELGNQKLIPYVEKLFADAKVKANRKNSRGESYSIAESALVEHQRWDYMPWE